MTRKEVLEDKASEIKNWDKKEIEALYILLIELQYLVEVDNKKRGWNGRSTETSDFIELYKDVPTVGDVNHDYKNDIVAVDEKNDCLFGSGCWMKNYHIKSLKSLS